MSQDPLKEIKTEYIDAQSLLPLLKNYKEPREWISRQVKKGRLIRIKNGLYRIAERKLEPEKLANILYGPSYVSLHHALAFYNLIPERVHTVTSVTTRRNKDFKTPLGHFTYKYLNRERYCISFTLTEGHFLMATAEKALVDFIHFYGVSTGKRELLEELIESYRIDESDLRNLNKSVLKEIAIQYKSPVVSLFIQALELL